MAAACALAIFSGKIIYKFGIPERLRTLRYSIFTGGVVMANGSCRARFLRKRLRCNRTMQIQPGENGMQNVRRI